jgi:hypothetical protein
MASKQIVGRLDINFTRMSVNFCSNLTSWSSAKAMNFSRAITSEQKNRPFSIPAANSWGKKGEKKNKRQTKSKI